MGNQNTTIKYFLYARKSTEDKEKQVHSTSDQIRCCKELAKKRGLSIVDVFSEEKSAKYPNNRPLFKSMLERIKKGEATGILCWKADRLSRNPVESGEISWMLQEGLIEVIQTIEREYKSDDNVLYLLLESGMANQYVRDLSLNVTRGMKSKRLEGGFPHRAPLGYLNKRLDDKQAVLIKDELRFPIVRRMWDYMLTGKYSPVKILEMANNEWGLRTRKTKKMGDKILSRSGIYKLFTNKFYTGYFDGEHGEYEAKHPPMISLVEFDRVQVLLGNNGKPRQQKHSFAFTGLMRCAECGCYYTAETKQKFNKKSGEVKEYTYYHCTRRSNSINCTQTKSIKEDELIRQFDELLSKVTIIPDFKDWALDVLRYRNDAEVENRTKANMAQQANLADAQRRKDNLLQLRLKDMIDNDTFEKEQSKLVKEIVRLREVIRDLEKRTDDWQESTVRAFNFAAYAQENYIRGNNETKRLILKTIGQNFLVKDGKVAVEANKWLVPIMEAAPTIKQSSYRLELEQLIDKQQKTEAFASVSSDWCAMKDSNLRPAD